MNYKIRDWEITLNRIKTIEQIVHDNTKLMISFLRKNSVSEAIKLRFENYKERKELAKLRGKLWRIEEQLLNPEEQHG